MAVKRKTKRKAAKRKTAKRKTVKRVTALRDIAMSPNQKLLMLPIEASGLIGSIAGIAEIAKEALSKNKE